MIELLTNAEMRRADQFAIDAGTPSCELMRRAGEAVGRVALDMCGGVGLVVVVCGPGNNGGDGFVAAGTLLARGVEVRLMLLGERARLVGDAALAADGYGGPVERFSIAGLTGAGLVVDALFGSGLSRDIDGEAAAAIAAINASGVPVLAVDVPSGVDGDSGRVRGCAVAAQRTVTFFRRKPGHLLLPGRLLCGIVDCVDIGIADNLLGAIAPLFCANEEPLWKSHFPAPALDTHKYRRGHAAVVSGGPYATGAGRLAARAALRSGAGLVTVVSPESAALVNAAQLTAIMLRVFADEQAFAAAFDDPRIGAVLIGPGAGVGDATRSRVQQLLHSERAVVLDADALISFAAAPRALFDSIAARSKPTVLSPHDGEFGRLFGDYAGRGDRLDRALHGARRSGAIMVLKGPDTVIADPSGRAVINLTGSPYLATAGSGDVLAGMIVGLLAQGMPGFEAAAAAVHLHGVVGQTFGVGLIAEDLAEQLPDALRAMLRRWRDDGIR